MAAPDATLITNGLALARLGEEWDVPRHRVRLVNPGRRLELGGRELTLLRPPSYGSPSSLAVSTLARSLSWSSRWPPRLNGWCGARPGGGKSGSQCSAGVDLGPYLDRFDGRPAARTTRHGGPSGYSASRPGSTLPSRQYRGTIHPLVALSLSKGAPALRHAQHSLRTMITSRVRGPCTPSTRFSSMSLVALGPLIIVSARVGASRANA
jgi:hypothetical protein